jgi:group I intron endonuclease
MKSGIYYIRNKANGKVYYGSSKNIQRRFADHRKRLRRKKHGNLHLQRAWNKYGEDVFEFGIVGYCEEEYLLDMEQVYLDNNPDGYNIAKCAAASTRGMKHSPETKEKCRLARLGQQCSSETREKIRQARLGKGRAGLGLGREVSLETREKLRRANIGRKHSPEALERMRLVQGSPEARERNRQAQLGRKKTPEQRERMRQGWAARKNRQPPV